MYVQLQKPSNYTSILVTCSTSREPLKTSKIDKIQQSPWRPATIAKQCITGDSYKSSWLVSCAKRLIINAISALSRQFFAIAIAMPLLTFVFISLLTLYALLAIAIVLTITIAAFTSQIYYNCIFENVAPVLLSLLSLRATRII